MQPSTAFNQLLANYAGLAVRVGLNLQPGQRLIITSSIEAAPLVRLVAAEAYRAGARLVDVIWDDPQVTLARFQNAPRDSFEEFPHWKAQALEDIARNGDARLSISADDPDLLKGQDETLITTAQKAAGRNLTPFYDLLMRNNLNWLVMAMPVPAWAAKVFPNLPAEEQLEKLWDAVFEVCRMKLPDPLAAWEQHVTALVSRSRSLTEKHYRALHYTAPGTDLTIGLPEGHLWVSGRMKARNGIAFVPNLPTEEVFTLAHKDRIDGEISSTRPLSFAGQMIENMHLVFRAGKVVDFSASAGEEVLRGLIETDEGSHSLGEIALVPDSSPISRSGLMFYNTLFDENASCHLALGRAYSFTLQGGEDMTLEAFAAAGGNSSLQHVDFMVGSDRLDIDGIRTDGTSEPVFRKGEWAF
jgi:aminopeptidase